MYQLFDRDVMDELFYEVTGSPPPRTWNYARKLDEFDLMEEEDEDYFDVLRELGAVKRLIVLTLTH